MPTHDTVAAPAMPDPHRPLEGVRVVDASRYLPGPFCALQLSWLGATVTCIEQHPDGDPMRTIPPAGEDGVSLAYRSLRRDARVEFLDLSGAEGRARALELCVDADVFIESFRPGVAARLGVGADELRTSNPGLVYCSISGYGQDGPWAQAPGHDIDYEAVAGLLEQCGTPEQVALPSVPVADLAGGQAAATAICAALVRRATTGTGCVIDLSLTEAALALQAMHLPGAHDAAMARGAGTLTGGLASYRPYRCSDDRWLALGPIEPKFFSALCDAIGRPDLQELQYDPASQHRLRAELEQVFASRPAADWDELLAGADGGGSCVAVALHPSEVAGHPQVSWRRAVRAGAGAIVMPASPYVIDGRRTDAEDVGGAQASGGSHT